MSIVGTMITLGGSGGGSTLITKNITANGSYSASDDSADGYSEVTVAVDSVTPAATLVDSGYGWSCSELFLSRTADELLATINGRKFEKINANPAIVIAVSTSTSSHIWLFSTNEDAVRFRSYSGTTPAEFSSRGTINVDGTTWYASGGYYGFPEVYYPTAGLTYRQLPISFTSFFSTSLDDSTKLAYLQKVFTAASVCMNS